MNKIDKLCEILMQIILESEDNDDDRRERDNNSDSDTDVCDLLL